ncbi:NAD(P)/FAD-dependent oxidoreductase [Salinimicrobium flavum]|uniref:NAD(P)/FAD-dependent oxidoreductase n=1 Tax=Salinimicrobium flavum TaxID=1737065 RepID=A0ABW5IUE6_9FLAO
MNFSFWEYDSWFSYIDFTVVGSGITGLNCALNLRQQYPNARILVVERGLLPYGASTRNAGFACFGSLSEILDDLNTHTEDEVVELIKKRVSGLELLRKNLGDENIGYEAHGGYELFTAEDKELFENCASKMPEINRLLKPVFGENIFTIEDNNHGFKNINPRLVYNKYEGQLDTGRMMTSLLHKVQAAGVKVLNNLPVKSFEGGPASVEVVTENFSFKTRKLFIATNGFASQLGLSEVRPARAQVLITKPIKNLNLKGTFHLDRGYYYFRNVRDRILFGGGRNLDLKGEETTEMVQTALIQNRLEELLKNTILPGKAFEIERRWSGVMGVGDKKKPVVKQVSENVFCGVRLGGMGVAIGSLVGKELAELIK